MRLLTPETPVHDPFLAAVRRRHPDVDLVLLPPPAPPPPSSGELDDADTHALRADLAERARRAWPADDEPTTTLRYGSVEAAVRAVARLAARPADPHAFLASLRANLAADGSAGARVTHAGTSGLVVLTLSSPDVLVGVQRARALVRAGDR